MDHPLRQYLFLFQTLFKTKSVPHITISKNFIPKPLKAESFALEQPLHVVALTCSASGILK
ncbi:MAG: hypothetical protein LBJ00_10605 [Planctomycetaceae bacterium]|nr:hypothetical protein [Planctomycetaceae bacterium]